MELYYSLQKLTTLKIGGLANYFIRVKSGRKLIEAIEWARKSKTKWYVIGEGSNLIPYDLFHPDEHGPDYYNFNDSEYDARETYAANVYGPTILQPAELNSHDIRTGMDMFLASLVAYGKSIINDPQNHIDRGYENIVEKLNDLGADIKRI